MNIPQTFIETKSSRFPLFSPSQLHILSKTWPIYYFPKYFQYTIAECLWRLVLSCLSMPWDGQPSLDTGDVFWPLVMEAIVDTASLGKVRDTYLAQSSAETPQTQWLHVRRSREAATFIGWSWGWLLLLNSWVNTDSQSAEALPKKVFAIKLF